MDRKFIKGFTENAKVKFIDNKLIECVMLGDDYKLAAERSENVN